jgi:hypothetical protein
MGLLPNGVGSPAAYLFNVYAAAINKHKKRTQVWRRMQRAFYDQQILCCSCSMSSQIRLEKLSPR